MTTEFKEQCITLAHEISAANETIHEAMAKGADPNLATEAKNVVVNVLRSFKAFIENLTESEKQEAQKLLHKKLDEMAHKAKGLQ